MNEILDYPQLQEDYPITADQIACYQKDGYIKLENVLTGETLAAFRDAVAQAVEAEKETDLLGGAKKSDPTAAKGVYEQIFIQRVNVWQRHPAVKPFVFSPRLANLAAKLSGTPVRIWHDQALFKEPLTGSKTPWHQDAPYWPHQDMSRQLSIWIALKDATTKNGCMSFLPGTHKFGRKEPINLGDESPKGVYEVAPEAAGIKAVTEELPAGSVTFHNGLCFHYAGPNRSEEMREAFVVIYMPEDTRFSGAHHPVMEGGSYRANDILDGEVFPKLSTIS